MTQNCSIELFNRCMPYFEVLKDVQRQNIIINLAEHHELSVTEIVEMSDLSMPAVSHHLKLLTQSGVIDSRKVGTKRFYRLTLEEAITDLEELLASLRTLSHHQEE